MLGIPSSTYYDWYARWVEGGLDGLADRSPRPRSVWNRIHKPRLLTDNGSSYVAADLADHLGACGIEHIRGAPHHPQTQGKIERWHQTLKNRILLEHYFLPGDLQRQIGAFIEHYNHHRYHESLGNLTPADVYHGRGAQILKTREEIKKQTIRQRRLQHQAVAA
jgi:transposase InsO family protein